jgi:hypothetical protein
VSKLYEKERRWYIYIFNTVTKQSDYATHFGVSAHFIHAQHYPSLETAMEDAKNIKIHRNVKNVNYIVRSLFVEVDGFDFGVKI